MGLGDYFERKEVNFRHQVWVLTQTGRQRLESISGQGVEGRVLDALHEEGTATLVDIVRNSGLNPNVVRRQLLRLQRQGYVQAMN